MIARPTRTVLLASAIAALAWPALAADADSANAGTMMSDQPAAMMLSAGTDADQGPVVAREALGTPTNARDVAVESSVEPTRSASNLSNLRRLRAARAARAAYNGNGYRSPPVILGVRF